VDVFSWTRCAALEFPGGSPNPWPQPGSGNLITWDPTNDCQQTYPTSVGYFYVAAYSPDTFQITPRPVDGEAKVAACDGAEVLLPGDDLGSAVFSSGAKASGCSPCFVPCNEPIPATQTTWGAIKALMR
jgi:hypothetical protein